MLADLTDGSLWNEPKVGALFGEFYYERFPHLRRGDLILGDAHASLWLSAIRSLVLEGAAARFPEQRGQVVIKDPHGAIGAPLLSRAIPKSRFVFLVRDPRDVVASSFDAQRANGWASGLRGGDLLASDRDPETFMRFRTQAYVWDLEHVSEAYISHTGPKVLVRYEDLRSDTLGAMRGACAALELDIGETKLAQTVDARSWERVPSEDKGPGHFHRKAEPGSWRDDLSEPQQRIVETIASPVLEAFYSQPAVVGGPSPEPSPEVMAKRRTTGTPVFPPGSRRVLEELVRILLAKDD